MVLLSFEEYQKKGGIADQTAFNRLIFKAEAYLRNFTLNRVSRLNEIPDSVKWLLVEFVDKLFTSYKNGDKDLKSYSNGVETFGWSKSSGDDKTLEVELYDLAVAYLPISLISCAVDSGEGV